MGVSRGYQAQTTPSSLEQGQDRRPESVAQAAQDLGYTRSDCSFETTSGNSRFPTLAIDSKLRACGLLGLRLGDIAHENHVKSRAVVMQRKTRRPVQFEITEMSRDAIQAWARTAGLRGSDYVFPSRPGDSPHVSMRQYARIMT
jgi:hypothetical protein